MKTFRTLDLAIEFYQKVKGLKLPKAHLQDQFDRALLSIVLNLSEGSAKPTAKDRRRFYVIAFGSLRETQCLLKIMNQNQLLKESDTVAACLYQTARMPGCLKF